MSIHATYLYECATMGQIYERNSSKDLKDGSGWALRESIMGQ